MDETIQPSEPVELPVEQPVEAPVVEETPAPEGTKDEQVELPVEVTE